MSQASAKICRLSEATINEIAAGEVIENPASAVKELVENSLDSTASKIEVDLLGGGLQMIRVADNGFGIRKEDFKLVGTRHATSKIGSSSDLMKICSNGFRGEALAAIASISALKILSASQEGEVGYLLTIDKGVRASLIPHARRRGTTIEVSQLFKHAPVRRHFQQSPRGCQTAIGKEMVQLMLSHPTIDFILRTDQGKELLSLQTPHQTPFARAFLGAVHKLLPESLGAGGESIEVEEGPLRLLGCFGSPAQARRRRSCQFLFVNRRPVCAPAIAFAVMEGYGTLLQNHHHPLFAIHLELSPSLIDINVHPQKREIRFKELNLVRNFVKRVVARLFCQVPASFLVPAPSWQKAEEHAPLPWEQSVQSVVRGEQREVKQQTMLSVIDPPSLPESIGLFGAFLLFDGAQFEKFAPQKKWQGLVFVDLVASHRRILFDQIQERQELVLQKLLLPVSIEVDTLEREQIEQHLARFEDLGLKLNLSSSSGFIIEEVDVRLIGQDLKSIVLNLIELWEQEMEGDRLEETVQQDRKALLYKLTHTQHKDWTVGEGMALLKQLLSSSDPYRSPEGTPTIGCLSEQAITTLFM